MIQTEYVGDDAQWLVFYIYKQLHGYVGWMGHHLRPWILLEFDYTKADFDGVIMAVMRSGTCVSLDDIIMATYYLPEWSRVLFIWHINITKFYGSLVKF